MKVEEIGKLLAGMQLVGTHIGRIELVEKGEVETKTSDTAGSRILVHPA